MAGNHVGVLNALDVAKTQEYHFTAIIIAGMGFFTDAYDLFSISLVTKLLGRIYYHVDGAEKPGNLPPNVAAAVNGVAFCGTLAGQLFFGWLGDKLGRKHVYGMTLMLMVISSIASGLSFGHSAKGVMATLCFFRFWLGFGIGGDYPPLCHHHVRICQQKNSWGIHRRSVCHARIWNFNWGNCCSHCVNCI
jgi:PHS family inorganic phosphate transporter-like MFS transporter